MQNVQPEQSLCWVAQTGFNSQGHAQGGNNLQIVPMCAFSRTQAMAVPPQTHSSCSTESLVSRAGGVPEGSHQSSTTGVASRMASQPSLQVKLHAGQYSVCNLYWYSHSSCSCLVSRAGGVPEGSHEAGTADMASHMANQPPQAGDSFCL